MAGRKRVTMIASFVLGVGCSGATSTPAEVPDSGGALPDAGACALDCGLYGDCKLAAGGIPTCQCALGFASTGASPCEDVDECALKTDDCGAFELCVNKDGSFGCTAPPDPCEPNPCQHEAACTPAPSGITCDCPAGTAGATCEIDVDECASKPCQHGGTCKDGLASFTCTCLQGFSGDACEIDVEECDALPCLNGGTCVSGAGWFTCACPAGFSGATCDVNDDDCAAEPCKNGTCSDLVNDYLCTCDAGFSGKKCKTNIDDCEGAPCQNGGVCVDGIDDYSCLCPPDFSGDICETLADACTKAPCKNGGVCSLAGESFACACPTGYTGPTCEAVADACTPAPCENGGTCSLDGGSFACSCPTGFEGLTCQTNVDDCAPNPCLNDSVCVDGVDAYECTCAEGWSGASCELETDECAPNPCKNGGACEDGIATFTCTCAEGFSGEVCSTDIDDCASEPCANGGTCKDGVDAYTCACAKGWSGATCETNLDECTPNPCQNGGACADGVGAFSCTCPDGWTGATCAGSADAMTLPETDPMCHEETFLDLSKTEGPGGNYPDPELSVTCSETTMTVSSNSVPHYTFVPVTPNALLAQDETLLVRLDAEAANPPVGMAVVSAVGVAINGVVIETPSEANDLKYGDPVGSGVVDACRGHTSGTGEYHYHGLVTTCFYPEADGSAASPIVGWMFDGYPILGPHCAAGQGGAVIEMKSSYEQANDPADCAAQSFTYLGDASDEDTDGDEFLDACNGHVGPDGDYHYHATSAYPWTIRCFRGTPSSSAMAVGGGEDPTFYEKCKDGAYATGGNPGGPVSCTTSADCTAATCPPGAVGCTCAQTPQGKLCIPTCTTSADCPKGPQGETMTCNAQKVCAPAPP